MLFFPGVGCEKHHPDVLQRIPTARVLMVAWVSVTMQLGDSSDFLFLWAVIKTAGRITPRQPPKTYMSSKKGLFSVGNTSSNPWFSRDMLVFRGVYQGLYATCSLLSDICQLCQEFSMCRIMSRILLLHGNPHQSTSIGRLPVELFIVKIQGTFSFQMKNLKSTTQIANFSRHSMGVMV